MNAMAVTLKMTELETLVSRGEFCRQTYDDEVSSTAYSERAAVCQVNPAPGGPPDPTATL